MKEKYEHLLTDPSPTIANTVQEKQDGCGNNLPFKGMFWDEVLKNKNIREGRDILSEDNAAAENEKQNGPGGELAKTLEQNGGGGRLPNKRILLARSIVPHPQRATDIV